MLSTRDSLKLNCAVPPPPGPYQFQYPYGIHPGDLQPLPTADDSFLQKNTTAYLLLMEILPRLTGVVVFTFFVISSSFILYGVIRHLYTDHMLPKRKKTLRKLGKLPEDKRRKKYRRRHSVVPGSSGPGSRSTRSGKTISSNYSRSTKSDRPYYMDDESDTSIASEYHDTLSETAPPLKRNVPLPPSAMKPLIVPGAVPKLPDAPKGIPKGTSPSPPQPPNKILPTLHATTGSR